MKIGVIGTIWLNTPPEEYGGTEEVVYNLVNGLVEKGHDVTLFAPATARTKAKLIPTVPRPLREDGKEWTEYVSTLLHLVQAFDHQGEFDILHVQLNRDQDYAALPLATFSKTPVVFTIHFQLPVYDKSHENRKLLLEKYKALPFIAISDSQRRGIDLNYIATVYNAVAIEKFPFEKKAGKYVVWIGRVTPEKGTKDAILAAKKANERLMVMGVVDLAVPEMVNYYDKEIKPLIDNKQIIWVGEVPEKQKLHILSQAKVFLNPIHWEEPFGLVMAEAQAVGTPVISYNKGSAPELIKDGKTGFLVNTFNEMVNKIAAVDTLDRSLCRQNVLEHFTVPAMVRGYLAAYEKAMKYWGHYLDIFHKDSDQ